jgi:hypothetical protein
MIELSFILITLLSVALLYLASGNDKRVLYFFSFWFAIVGMISATVFFQNEKSLPPRLLFVIIPSALYIIHFYKKLNVQKSGLFYLLAIHTLRLPVEIVLYRLFLKGKIPVIMTYKGWNFDIAIGTTAILLLVYVGYTKKELKRTFLRIWNIMGVLFLSIIVIIAMLSAPSPIQQLAFDQPNMAVLQFPFTFLPAVVVPIVLLSHLLSLKYLKNKDNVS